MATERAQRAEDGADSDDSTDGRRPNFSPEDSADSEDSVDGKRPNFSSEERALHDKLLKNSNQFIRDYEEHQPQLQQNIDQLFKISEEVLNKCKELVEIQRSSRRAAVKSVVGFIFGALFFLLFYVSEDEDIFTILGAAGASAAIFLGSFGLAYNTRNQYETRKLSEEMKEILKQLRTSAETASTCLKNFANLAEKIRQCHRLFSSRICQREELRQRADALAELDLLLKADLWRFLKEKETFSWKEKLAELVPSVPLITEEGGTGVRRRGPKVGKRGRLMEMRLKSEAGRSNWKTIRLRLRKIEKDMKTSNWKLERRVIHKLTENINQ